MKIIGVPKADYNWENNWFEWEARARGQDILEKRVTGIEQPEYINCIMNRKEDKTWMKDL